jgi:uncharacterized membrane protein YfcA
VRWLVAGAVPAAFGGVLILRALGEHASPTLEPLLGVALLVASAAMIHRARLARRRGVVTQAAEHVPVRPLATLAVGLAGGLIVGLTSVGSGSLMMVLLVALYPALDTRTLVGTDLVQAIPLVASAALGHMLLGDVELALTTSLLVGAVPAAYAGARLSSRADDRWMRPVLVGVLVASAARLLDAPGAAAVAFGAAGAAAAALARRGAGTPGEVELANLQAAPADP